MRRNERDGSRQWFIRESDAGVDLVSVPALSQSASRLVGVVLPRRAEPPPAHQTGRWLGQWSPYL